MADNTKIEWTEATWNPITGCSVTSPGCTNCYAMKLAGTRLAHHPSRAGLTRDTKAGPVWTGEVRFNEAWLTQPLRWKRPRRIFVCAHGDLFHESVPDAWIDRVFAVMALAPQHTFQVLTKRSARMREYCLSRYCTETGADQLSDEIENLSPNYSWEWDSPLPNVWLGVSVEDQTRADERIPDLLATPAAVRWLSCEPLLGPVLLGALPWEKSCDCEDYRPTFDSLEGTIYCQGCCEGPERVSSQIDWIVVGGESGPGARPMHPDWARSLRDQCKAAGVPFFFKQWGEWAPPSAFGATSYEPLATSRAGIGNWKRQYVVCGDDRADRLNADSFTGHPADVVFQVGKARAGRLLDGVEHSEWPA